MNTAETWQTVSTSLEGTLHIASQVGKRLRGSEVIELDSDLGGGKTTFVKGMIKGAGSTDTAASPTFTIMRMYKTPGFDFHHYDFYRLAEAGVVGEEFQESLDDPKVVTVVEWGGTVQDVLPPERLKIMLKPEGETARHISMTCPPELSYLLDGLTEGEPKAGEA